MSDGIGVSTKDGHVLFSMGSLIIRGNPNVTRTCPWSTHLAGPCLGREAEEEEARPKRPLDGV